METTGTVVLGAGPSGLAVAACLKQRGRPVVQIDRARQVGATWRGHYDRLHLHTMKEHSALPGLPFPAHYPRYPSRQQVVDYLDQYARHFDLRPRLGVTVQRARRRDGAWEIETDAGALRAQSFVIAAGYNAAPRPVDWPGLGDFGGEVVHSGRYRNGAPFAGRRVLVVGAGNSGAEIAIDLVEHGATVSLCVRSPIHVVPREVSGIPAQLVGIAYSKMPLRVADALAQVLTRIAIPDLAKYGLRRPKPGPVRQVVQQGRVPLIDVGTLSLIEQGAITVVPGIERFEPGAAIFADGRRVALDAVVLATGYRTNIADFLENADAVLDQRSYPRWHGVSCPPLPGLYFCGYANPISGALRQSGIEARRIAAAVA